MNEIKVGQTWVDKDRPTVKIKILQAGTSFPYKYKHKVKIYVPNVLEKEQWMDDGTIVIGYTLVELKDKIDVLLGNA